MKTKIYTFAVFFVLIFAGAVTTVRAAENLVLNPSLEIAGSSGDAPSFWQRGNWGSNDAAWSYPVAGVAGEKAAKVTVSNYQSGDAKWYFDDVLVSSGSDYIFSDKYLADASNQVVIRYRLSDGSYQYIYLGPGVVANSWQTFSKKFTVPVGVSSVTIFHLLQANGSLTVDDYFLTKTSPEDPNSNAFPRGMVSLNFDDGWFSQYRNALPILADAGYKADFFIITNELKNADQNEPVANPELEIAAGDSPENWLKGKYGTNTAVFSYPVPGKNGKAAKIDMTSYRNGDAKWYFKDVPVVPNHEYVFLDTYLSTAQTTVTLRYTLSDGSMSYIGLENLPSTGGAWKTYSKKFKVPSNVVSLTVFHLIRTVGSLSIDGASLSDQDLPYMNTKHVQNLQFLGQAIGDHTKTHPHLLELTDADMQNEIAGSRADLQSVGISPADIFVYPYGEFNDAVKQVVKNAGFIGARSVETGFNSKDSDRYALFVKNVNFNTPLSEVKAAVDAALQNREWLILVFHQIDESGSEYSTSPANLKQIIDYLKQKAAPVVRMDDVVPQIKP